MKSLTANDTCGKSSTSCDPCRTVPIRPEFKLVIYEFAGKYSIQECFAQQLASRYVSAGSQCHNENAEVVRNK